MLHKADLEPLLALFPAVNAASKTRDNVSTDPDKGYADVPMLSVSDAQLPHRWRLCRAAMYISIGVLHVMMTHFSHFHILDLVIADVGSTIQTNNCQSW